MYRYWIVIVALLYGCDAAPEGTLVSKHFQSQASWAYSDSLTFTYEAKSVDTLNLKANIRFTQAYPFNNLYLRLSYISPNHAHSDTLVNQVLMDAQGQWYGKLQGDRVEDIFEAFPKLILTQTGVYKFAISQYMRVDSLAGIERIYVYPK